MILSEITRNISSSSELQSRLDSRSSSSLSASEMISRMVLSNIGVSSEANLVYYPSGTSSTSNNQAASLNPTSDSVETLCAICLEEQDEEKGDLYIVTGCSHVYHKHCISRWMEKSRKCPICRGPIANDLGPPLSGLHLMLTDEVIPEMTRVGILENVIFSPIGVAWPICLVLLFLVFEAACFGIFVALVFFMALYVMFQEESHNIAYCICIVIVLCLVFPPVIVILTTSYVLQVFYILHRTVAFYINVCTCKMRWSSAYKFIINRTVALIMYAVQVLEEM